MALPARILPIAPVVVSSGGLWTNVTAPSIMVEYVVSAPHIPVPIDPDAQDAGDSRRAVSGVARRARRLYKRAKKRLDRLDAYIESLGWPLIDLESYQDRSLSPSRRSTASKAPVDAPEGTDGS